VLTKEERYTELVEDARVWLESLTEVCSYPFKEHEGPPRGLGDRRLTVAEQAELVRLLEKAVRRVRDVADFLKVVGAFREEGQDPAEVVPLTSYKPIPRRPPADT
jgi:hypothetical protein